MRGQLQQVPDTLASPTVAPMASHWKSTLPRNGQLLEGRRLYLLMNNDPASTYWNQPLEALFAALPSSPVGLSAAAATRRLAEYGPNLLRAREKVTALRLLLEQFKSPLVFILLVVRTHRPLFKQAGPLSVGQHAVGRPRHARHPLFAFCRGAGLCASAAAYVAAAGRHHAAVRRRQRDRQASLLPESTSLSEQREPTCSVSNIFSNFVSFPSTNMT